MLGVILGVLTDVGVVRAVIATFFVWLVGRIGLAMIVGLAQPVPEPPEAGELRKVKLTYKCSVCGAEVKMTVAPSQDPEPPRHCMDEMELVLPPE